MLGRNVVRAAVLFADGALLHRAAFGLQLEVDASPVPRGLLQYSFSSECFIVEIKYCY